MRTTAAITSHELVSCGNRGNSDAVVEWVPAASLVQFDQTFVRLLRLVCNTVVLIGSKAKASCFPTRFFFFFKMVFPGAPEIVL